MTAVWWEYQIDPSLFFGIPQVTSQDMSGNALENHQLTPDVVIKNTPDEIARGVDAQLIGATKRLLDKIDKK
jgi:C-terminal processing protease CtpA/Prc